MNKCRSSRLNFDSTGLSFRSLKSLSCLRYSWSAVFRSAPPDRFSDISLIECFIGSPKRFGYLFFVCLELRLTLDSSALDSSENPCVGSNVVSFSEICWGFPLISSATLWTPRFNSWSFPKRTVPNFGSGICLVCPLEVSGNQYISILSAVLI